jgi:hypothetical protein
MSGPLIATVAARRFAAAARVLADSLARHHPGLELRVLALDSLAPAFAAGDPRVVPVERLPTARTRSILFGYEEREAAIALKPVWIEHLLDHHRSVLFLDADLWVTGSLEPLLEAAERSAWTLTPHRLSAPSGDPHRQRELRLLVAGTFNGGVLAIGGAARRLVSWWRERVSERCVVDFARGLHHDQRWLDLLPGFLPQVEILRDPGINVAYWNLDERPLAPPAQAGRDGEGWTAAGRPLRLFHFSGFDPLEPERPTRHPDFARTPAPGFVELARHYARRVVAHGHAAMARSEYPRDRFANGVRVPAAARWLYREQGEGARRFGDPFAVEGAASFFAFLREPAPGDAASARPISRLLDAIYRLRPDVARAYPDPRGADRVAFLHWAATSGVREHGLDPELAAAPGSNARG